MQGCGSGSGLDPDSTTLWIRIRIGSGFSDFVDPDPDWIRIQRLFGSGSGSVLGIRIPDPDPGASKLSNISGKMHFLVIFIKKILPLKKYKIALSTFWKFFWWITQVFLIWFDLNFYFKKIWERTCLRKFCFSLDPDPDWAKMLDPDP
jgi:hypothetical protein